VTPPLDLAALQQRVAVLLAPVAHPRAGAALALAEETGEVCKLVLERECYGTPDATDKLGGELADVLVCVAELATRYGIDLDAVVQAKLEDLARRVPGWTAKLGPPLEDARRRMDGPPEG
jgi:NTP pyrophosphatase (non-canonical NTP hydrolase)